MLKNNLFAALKEVYLKVFGCYFTFQNNNDGDQLILVVIILFFSLKKLTYVSKYLKIKPKQVGRKILCI